MITKKQQFLSEHNRLSPRDLQSTLAVLSRFRAEKASLFKDDDWSIDKLRRPFILWLTSLPLEERELPDTEQEPKQSWHSYFERSEKQGSRQKRGSYFEQGEKKGSRRK